MRCSTWRVLARTNWALENVEFLRLELEWIDLPAASVDAVLCRWGIMLCVDPAAAASEIRRVLRPGGRLAAAVWDSAELNPWATLDWEALVELGHMASPDPSGPGMFALAPASRVSELLEGAGFVEVVVEEVQLDRSYSNVEEYIDESLDFSATFAEVWNRLDEQERAAVSERIAALAAPCGGADGSLQLPGRSLVASAGA